MTFIRWARIRQRGHGTGVHRAEPSTHGRSRRTPAAHWRCLEFTGSLYGSNHVAVADDEDMTVRIRHLEGAVGRAVDDDSYLQPLRLPFVMGSIEVLHHEVPTDGTGLDMLWVVKDHQVRPASHLEHREVLSHFDRAHPDPLVEACRHCRVACLQDDVAGPNPWTTIGDIHYEHDRTLAERAPSCRSMVRSSRTAQRAAI